MMLSCLLRGDKLCRSSERPPVLLGAPSRLNVGSQVTTNLVPLAYCRLLKSVIHRPSDQQVGDAHSPPSNRHRYFRRKSSTSKTSPTVECRTSIPRTLPQLPYEIHYKILSYLSLRDLLQAKKVNQSFERACNEHILKRFFSLPDLHFACAKRAYDDTGGVYGLEGVGKPDAHQYVLIEDYPCDFRVLSTFLITTWPMPDALIMEDVAAGHRLKTFAITVGRRSKWVVVFNLDDLRRRRKANPDKAISVPSIIEVYYHDSQNATIKGEWTARGERSKLVYVPETENWYFTWQLSALVTFGVMDDESL